MQIDYDDFVMYGRIEYIHFHNISQIVQFPLKAFLKSQWGKSAPF